MAKTILDKQDCDSSGSISSLESDGDSSCSMSSMESDIGQLRALQKIEQMAAPDFQIIVTKPTPAATASTSQTPRLLTPNSSFVYKPESRRHTGQSIPGSDGDGGSRRPSMFNGFQPRQSFSIYRKQFMDFLQRSGSRLSVNKKEDPQDESPFLAEKRSRNRAVAEDHFSTAISALYAKLLIVLGIAFPITDVVAEHTMKHYYEGFFLYLYFTSAFFIGFMCFVVLRHQTRLKTLLEGFHQPVTDIPDLLKPKEIRFGSFYLRVGAIAFGIGSMVYSGLEFGQYFELKGDERCQNVLIALIPAARMTLCLLQMQFIFFSSGQFHMERHKFVSRFGLMHMLATNLCEWLYVIIEEAKHEIVHITHGGPHDAAARLVARATAPLPADNDGFQLNATHYHQNAPELPSRGDPSVALPVPAIECHRTNIMGSLIQNAAPFLFPCTIEYSLICAVILFEMWKKLRDSGRGANGSRKGSRKSLTGKSANLLSIDCSNAQRGMFGGILVIVLTIIVLIMYFVLQKERFYKRAATIEVTIYEIVIYSITAGAVLWAMFQMRDLKFSQKKGDAGISLDCTLLALAQTGIEIYCIFSIIGTFFSIGVSEYATVYSLLAEIICLLQTALQTLFIMNAWWRRCKGTKQNRAKPGREIITFLLIANMSIWFINTLIKTNASFRPTLMNFYGIWAWTIITHLSMPLAIFYRFHSTICLFEVWKNTYKCIANYPPAMTASELVAVSSDTGGTGGGVVDGAIPSSVHVAHISSARRLAAAAERTKSPPTTMPPHDPPVIKWSLGADDDDGGDRHRQQRDQPPLLGNGSCEQIGIDSNVSANHHHLSIPRTDDDCNLLTQGKTATIVAMPVKYSHGSSTILDQIPEDDPPARKPPAVSLAHHANGATSRRSSIAAQDILSTRRPSTIMNALRRGSLAWLPGRNKTVQHDTESNRGSKASLSQIPSGHGALCDMAIESRRKNRRIGDDALSTALSALYAKVIVILGIALPVTEILSSQIPANVYQGFYLYLYVTSISFVVFVYASNMRRRAVMTLIKSYHEKTNNYPIKKRVPHFGSFYLRVGAIAFGIGTMVYSGLELGQYFELHTTPGCSSVFIALTPAARMILSIVQMQFIFLNTSELDMARHKVFARFGLMHMVATNLCEWLYVLVEETKHEIHHLAGHTKIIPTITELTTAALDIQLVNETSAEVFLNQNHSLEKRASKDLAEYIDCKRTNIMGSLVQNASPFLFPCTIEYSLICAVILYEMWKKVKNIAEIDRTRRNSHKVPSNQNVKSAHHFSVDCSRAHRGMFGGIIVTVLTIICLIMYFVLHQEPGYEYFAIQEVTIAETLLYSVTAAGVLAAMIKMRDLKYCKKQNDPHAGSVSLDCTLLVLAQTGVYVYGMFSIIGSYFSIQQDVVGAREGLIAEVFSLVQTSMQTLFILNAVWRKCRGSQQNRTKPGRQIVTFLLVANMAMWFINTLIKGRASFRPSHLNFFGTWAWTVITHVSMPLAIFYRFHSTICLFEVWKSTYKVKSGDHH